MATLHGSESLSNHQECSTHKLRGGLIVNKPSGISSFDVIRRLREVLGRKTKMGHAGTLDPAASGVLLILIGEATRVQHLLSGLDKEYVAGIRLGMQTDTLDAEGTITNEVPVPPLEVRTIQEALKKLAGTRLQHPPRFSALKVKGKRAYRMAREGQDFELEPREVTIHSIELENWNSPVITIRTSVSSGTYIRSLAAETGGELGLPASLVSLTRKRIGGFDLQDSLDLDNAEISAIREAMIPIEKLLEHLPSAELDPGACELLLQGKYLTAGFSPALLSTPLSLVLSQDRLQAFLCVPYQGKLRSKRLLYDDRGQCG